MKLKPLKLIWFCLLFSYSNLLGAADATITVDPIAVNPHPISNYLNGGFIEFLLDYVNGPMGLWAQEIQDRGFEEAKNPNQTDEVLYHWKRYNATKEQVQLTAGGYNKADKYQLQIAGTTDTELGLYQQVWLSDTVAHKFYIYTKSESATGTAKIILFDTLNQTRLFEKEIDINYADWQKLEFEIPAIANYHTLNFAITYQGSGTVYFDEVSLMPANNFHGIRKEWENYLRLWKLECLRYPGGSFVDGGSYKWEYSTGDIDQRKSAIYFSNGQHNQYTQRMDFGINELVQVCKELNIEPVLVLSLNNDSSTEANYIEYCNGDTNTAMGKLRLQHSGSVEPYNIKFWEITNELFFFYTPEDLANRMLLFEEQMRKKDSSITIIANGNTYSGDYIEKMFDILGNKVDVYGIHPNGGSQGKEIEDNEKWYWQMQFTSFELRSRLANHKDVLSKSPGTKFSCNEWWCHYGNGNDWLLDTNVRNLSLEATLWNAQIYLAFISYPEFMSYCARTMGIGLFRRWIYPDGRKTLYVSPALFALQMLAQNQGDYLVKSQTVSPTYEDYNTQGYWIPATPYLDVTTTKKGDTLFLAVVNRSIWGAVNTDIKVENTILKPQCKVLELTSEHYLDYPTPDQPDKIKPTERDVTLELSDDYHNFNYSFPKHSVTIIAIAQKDSSIMPEPPETAMTVSPMPIDKDFRIMFNTNKHINDVKIYDITGTLVYDNVYDFYSNTITISNLSLAQGAYQLVVNCEEGSYDMNLIIRK